MRDYLSEGVSCHLIKYGVILAVSLLLVFLLEDRLPEKFDRFAISDGERTLTAFGESVPAMTLTGLQNRMTEIGNYVEDDHYRNIGFLLLNTSDKYPANKAFTLHQICTAIISTVVQSSNLRKCNLKEISETELMLAKLHEYYILERFQWDNDPLRLKRYRLSRLGFDLVSVFQRSLIDRGKFTAEDRSSFDLRPDNRLEQPEVYQTY